MAGMSMAENVIRGEFGGTMRTRRCGASCSPAPDVGHFNTLGIMPGGVSIFRAGEAMAEDRATGRVGQRMDVVGLAWLLSPWLLA